MDVCIDIHQAKKRYQSKKKTIKIQQLLPEALLKKVYTNSFLIFACKDTTTVLLDH